MKLTNDHDLEIGDIVFHSYYNRSSVIAAYRVVGFTEFLVRVEEIESGCKRIFLWSQPIQITF